MDSIPQALGQLISLLIAEKEEKRQLYNRFKELERHRDQLAGEVMGASFLRSEVAQLREENRQLDAMLSKAVDAQVSA